MEEEFEDEVKQAFAKEFPKDVYNVERFAFYLAGYRRSRLATNEMFVDSFASAICENGLADGFIEETK